LNDFETKEEVQIEEKFLEKPEEKLEEKVEHPIEFVGKTEEIREQPNEVKT